MFYLRSEVGSYAYARHLFHPPSSFPDPQSQFLMTGLTDYDVNCVIEKCADLPQQL